MSEADAVISKFKKYIYEVVELIEDILNENNLQDVKLWLNELIVEKDKLQREYESPSTLIIKDPWVKPTVLIDTRKIRELALIRLQIVNEALRTAEKLIKEKKQS